MLTPILLSGSCTFGVYKTDHHIQGAFLLKEGFLILILNVKLSKNLQSVKTALLTDHFAP